MAFLVRRIYPYGITLYLFTDNGSQCISMFVEHVCSALSLKHILTTAYHPQTNKQAEKVDRT